ncbi:unnamed protein product, partial [Ectocarpus sp. 6 AP-2014]
PFLLVTKAIAPAAVPHELIPSEFLVTGVLQITPRVCAYPFTWRRRQDKPWSCTFFCCRGQTMVFLAIRRVRSVGVVLFWSPASSILSFRDRVKLQGLLYR